MGVGELCNEKPTHLSKDKPPFLANRDKLTQQQRARTVKINK